MKHKLGTLVTIIGLLVSAFGMVTPTYAASFTVNTTLDTVDATPGDGICRDAAGHCSLRAAIMEANKTATADTITLGSGTYKLTITGADDVDAKGDLDVLTSMTITGVSAAATIIDAGTTADRVFDVRNKVTLALNTLTVKNGKGGAAADNGGGAIRASGGSNVTLTTVTLQNNLAGPSATTGYFGGAILFNFLQFGSPTPGVLTITGSTIQSNIAARSGGGIALGGGSTLTMKTTKLLSNTANGTNDSQISQYGGGALYMASGFTPIGGSLQKTTATLTSNAFTGNIAKGSFVGDGWGGAIFDDVATVLTLVGGTFTSNQSADFGGAVYAAGKTTITGSIFTSNTTQGSGGALSSVSTDGTTITSATFTLNKALSTDATSGAGAIDMNGPFAFRSLTVTSNSAAVGGGIRFHDSLGTIQTSMINSNHASLDGGGLNVAPGERHLYVTSLNNTFDHNTADQDGGGVFNAGEMVITGGSVTNNTATNARGGGVYNYQSFLFSMTGTLVSNNTAGLAGGGIYTRHTTFGSNGDDPKTPVLTGLIIQYNHSDQGGGLANDLSVRVVNTAIVSNTATYGGGVLSAERTNASDYVKALDFANVTVSGNTASDSGGGIYNQIGRAYLNSVTVANNAVRKGTAVAGNGGGIFNDPASAPPAVISNLLLANNVATTGPDCNGTFNSGDYNLIRTVTGCTVVGTTTHNILNANPLINPLKNNGGNTLTHGLLSTSPARNKGNPAAFGSSLYACPKTDQRGANRVAPCDIGAFEIAPLP